MGASSVKYVPATSLETRRNPESKHYWRFYAMSAERYDSIFQNTESSAF